MDQRTGEVVPSVDITIPAGSIIITPFDRQERRKRLQAEAQRKLRRAYSNELGHFYFAHEDCTQSIKPQTLARLLFLATYLGYNNSLLYCSERKMLKKAELPDLLKLKSNTFYKFWGEVSGKYIYEQPDGSLKMSPLFCRGKLQNRTDRKSAGNYQQIYIEALRQLYWQTPVSKHCHLGYVFEMLPHINWEYNLLCWNPSEKDLEKVDLMTIDELCAIIGYNKSQRARLWNSCQQLKFQNSGRTHNLVSFVPGGDMQIGNMRIFINPRVIYRGSNWHRVEILGAF